MVRENQPLRQITGVEQRTRNIIFDGKSVNFQTADERG